VVIETEETPLFLLLIPQAPVYHVRLFYYNASDRFHQASFIRRTSLLILRTFAFIRRTSVCIPQTSAMDRATPKAL